MLLGIGRHAIGKRRSGMLDRRIVVEETLIKAIHLVHQLRRVGISARRRREHTVVLGFVAPQQQQVLNTQKLQIEQFIFDILCRCTAAYHMRHHGQPVSVLQSSGNGHRSRTAPHAIALELSVGQLLVDVFAVVRRDVDEKRFKFSQLVNRGKQAIGAVPFQGWQHLKREPSPIFMLLNNVYYLHTLLQR